MGIGLGTWLGEGGSRGGQVWSSETKDLNYKASGMKQVHRCRGGEAAKARNLSTVSEAPGEGQSKSNL